MINNKAFTLIELIVVVSIIAILTAVTTFSYRASLVNSRDARRKSDVEQIRAALELYRSNNNTYPATASVPVACGSALGLTDVAGNTYMSNVPEDPKCTATTYYYAMLSAGADYTLGTRLEAPGPSVCTVAVSCGAAGNCNYCMGPYGQK